MCKITGFTGIVTSVTKFINGCIQVGVTPKVENDNKVPDSVDIDIEQIKVIGVGLFKKIKEEPTGGSQSMLNTKRKCY